LEYREPVRESQQLHGWRSRSVAASGRTVRLGDDGYDLLFGIEERGQGRKSKNPRAEENDAWRHK